MNDSTNSTDSNPEIIFKSDGYIAAAILGITVLAVFLGGIYVCFNKKYMGIRESSWNNVSSVEPPIERQKYIDARKRLDPSNPQELEELKKLLMRRAIRAIPILLSLQNEGNSIERLYKRGMLTDDMHFKVKDLKSFVDQEFSDVQFEAEDLVEGWNQHIWPQAMSFHTTLLKHAEGKNPGKISFEEEEEVEKTEVTMTEEKEKKIVEKPKKIPKEESPPAEPKAAEEVAPVDPIKEANRMAALLLAEEESAAREKEKSQKKNTKNGKK